MEDEELEQATQISLHSVRNLLGNEQQMSLFDEEKVRGFAETYGMNIESEISRYGIDLTDIQQRMMESILFGFTKTRYRGNIDPIDKPSHAKEKYPTGNLPSTYKYVQKLPKLKVTQTELLKWANVNQRSAGEIQVALKALKHLGTAQYCFYYSRLALDEEGRAKKDRDGEYQKEEVIAIDTLFTVKEVRNKKSGLLNYYEIIPSSIFLDQRESYFMLIPFNWREEVRRIVGQRKASSYTFRFLILLRYLFELQRRNAKEKKQFLVKCTSEEMAIKLKMPESVYRRKKDRANKILDEVYSVAKRLGYLLAYERTALHDILYLNEEKYYQPRSEEIPLPQEVVCSDEMKRAKELLDLITRERRKLVPTYNPMSGGQIQEHSLKHLAELLKLHPFDTIAEVVVWGINKEYWCNRIGTPSKLRKFFEEALVEMRASQHQEKSPPQVHREMAERAAQLTLPDGIRIELLSSHVEISDGSHHVVCIDYSDKQFSPKFQHALKQRGIFID